MRGVERLCLLQSSHLPPLTGLPYPFSLSPHTIEAEGCARVLVEASAVGREGKWECENRAGPKGSCKTGPKPQGFLILIF